MCEAATEPQRRHGGCVCPVYCVAVTLLLLSLKQTLCGPEESPSVGGTTESLTHAHQIYVQIESHMTLSAHNTFGCSE